LAINVKILVNIGTILIINVNIDILVISIKILVLIIAKISQNHIKALQSTILLANFPQANTFIVQSPIFSRL
jgi:hypothetical protein